MARLLLSVLALAALSSAVPSPQATASSASSQPTSFFLVDPVTKAVGGALFDPDYTTGIFFGPDYNLSTYFVIDSSTSILVVQQQPGPDTVIDTSDPNSPVQVSGTVCCGYLRCTVSSSNELSCDPGSGHTQFVLDNYPSSNSSDLRLYLVEPGTIISPNARDVVPLVQYAAPAPPPAVPPKFWIYTAEGPALAPSTLGGVINAGLDYHEGAQTEWTLSANPGQLQDADSTYLTGSPLIAYIDTAVAVNGYAQVHLGSQPLTGTQEALTCAITTDGSKVLSCTADGGYNTLWLDLGHSTSDDYTLYIATQNSTGIGNGRQLAGTTVAQCTGC